MHSEKVHFLVFLRLAIKIFRLKEFLSDKKTTFKNFYTKQLKKAYFQKILRNRKVYFLAFLKVHF